MSGLLEIPVRRSRPGRLSDPHRDHDEASLRELLGTRDDLLTWRHFQSLFCPWLPAGTYEEVVYFLPLALRFVYDRREDVEEVVGHLLGWIATNQRELQADDLWDVVRDNVVISLEHWTEDFDVVPSHGGPAADSLIGTFRVRNSRLVTHTLQWLCVGRGLRDLAPRFLRSLAFHSSNKFQRAWILELSRSLPSAFSSATGRTGSDMPDDIAAILQDEAIRRRAAAVVLKELVPWPSQTVYWQETFEVLGIA